MIQPTQAVVQEDRQLHRQQQQQQQQNCIKSLVCSPGVVCMNDKTSEQWSREGGESTETLDKLDSPKRVKIMKTTTAKVGSKTN